MRLLTITVPCYNSEDYLMKALESVEPQIEKLDLIIVNDGSTDGTLQLAEGFRDRHPDNVRVIDKENGGHGSGVMAGLRASEGLYYYVLDSDDWLDPVALARLLERLELEHQNRLDGQPPLDLLICNYVYRKVGTEPKPVNYISYIPEGCRFTWEELKRLPTGIFFTMHSLIYRTEILRQSGLDLPDHTFYVDNLVAYVPLPFVNTIVYEDIDLYQYFIGRDEQSVNREVLIRRIDQHILVTKLVAQAYHLDEAVASRKLARYMNSYLSILMTVTNAHLYMSGKPENELKAQELWDWLEDYDPEMYRYCKGEFLNWGMELVAKAKWGESAIKAAYNWGQRVFRFS